MFFPDLLALPFGGYAGQRFALSVLLGILALYFVTSYMVRWPVDPYRAVKTGLPTLLLCLAYFLLTLPYLDQPYPWVESGLYGFFFLSTFSTGATLSWRASGAVYSQYLLVFIAVCCVFYGLASVNVYLFAITDGVTDLVGFIPWGVVNIRYWSHIATWCLPLMPLAVLVGPLKSNRLWRAFVLSGAGLWWWILLLSTGRGSVLGILFGAVLVVCLFGRLALPWLKIFLKYMTAGGLLWLLLSVIIPSLVIEELQLRSITAGDAGRVILFIEAWTMSLQNFPLGMGPQSWLTHDVLTEAYANHKKFGHPHNMYLMWAAEYGWLLIAALGLVVAQAITYTWRKRREVLSQPGSEQALLLVGFVASVSAALFHGGVSAVFMAPGSMLVGLFILIAFWSLVVPGPNDLKTKQSARPAVGKRAMIACVVVGLVLTFWAGWMREVVIYYQDMVQDEEQYHKGESEGIQPRFWFHGNFPRR